jgi:glycerol-3-phosphate O-acyltransferase/dihydroxyacetone phosphate acyltransferase
MKQLKASVKKYNEQLRLLGISDHQVEYARFSIVKVVSKLLYRVGKISVLAVGTIPGLILFAPVFAVSKVVSHRKSQQDLKASTVKLQGHDVMATWKLLISLALAPILYAWYTVILTYWFYYNRIQGYAPLWVEERVPMWILILLELVLFTSVTFAALLIGEVGMDILKSLRPLVLCLNPTSANTLGKVREQRKRLSKEVTELIVDLAPDMFPDCDAVGTMKSPDADEVTDTLGEDAQSQKPLPRNSSLHNLANIGFFSTPGTAESEGLRMSASVATGEEKKIQ